MIRDIGGSSARMARISSASTTELRYLRLALVLLQIYVGVKQAQGFRLVDENGTTIPFVPYEKGFVGR